MCKNFVLDQDGEPICPCGDEGRVCESCADAEYEYWKDQFLVASPEDKDPEQYAQDMKDSGRRDYDQDPYDAICESPFGLPGGGKSL